MKQSTLIGLIISFSFLSVSSGLKAQEKNAIIESIISEANNNSDLERLAHQITDVIGPRLVGTPQMQHAHDWAVSQLNDWGIDAENQTWGEWRGWERGICHIDLVEPRVVSLQGRQLAWSPSTGPDGVSGSVVIIPDVADAAAFQAWLPQVKGKFVMIAMNQPSGRPDYNWEEFATPESFAAMKEKRDADTKAWRERIQKTGYDTRTLPKVLEEAGAAGILDCNWSRGFGANKVFSARTNKIPTLDLSLEDYGLLYRLAEYGDDPIIRVTATSKELGNVPTYNTIATIRGSEKPEEYVMLSAHFDSWDGGTGATDNGTGSMMMMEVMRILKKVYPNPKRTIMLGLWGSEEQGLNGSRAFVEDHPEVVQGLQALFNQDNGTGRVVRLSGQGFLHAYDYLGRWLAAVPDGIRQQIETTFPGTPGGGGSDYASFVAAGAPAFSLSSLNWSYFSYTWHTNLDTYDKIVFGDVKNNVILAAILVYMACEDPEFTSREKSVLPVNLRTGEQRTWPEPKPATRKGGTN